MRSGGNHYPEGFPQPRRTAIPRRFAPRDDNFNHPDSVRHAPTRFPDTLKKRQMAPPSFIYVMKDLRKVVPPSREILRGIWLSFYHGAKIGVLGANGAGKSSLLRIMAGVDHDFQGEAWAAEGTRISYLPQEPALDPSLDVRGNVELAVKAQRDLLDEFQEISNKFAEPM